MLIITVTKSRPSPIATASRMLGKNFSLFSMYFGANSWPLVRRADVLGAVDDLELAVGLEEAGVAGLDVTVLGQRLAPSCRARGSSRRTCPAT